MGPFIRYFISEIDSLSVLRGLRKEWMEGGLAAKSGQMHPTFLFVLVGRKGLLR
jgi:hypothetical protein